MDCKENILNLLTGEKWTRNHVKVFVHTFFSYALIHASRKTLSTVKPSLINAWTNNSTNQLFESKQSAAQFLATLDTSFMITYAIGLYISGLLADHFNPRKLLTLGMTLSAITVFIFGYLTETWQIYSIPLYSILWIANGLFQSVGWPVEVSIMGNWFSCSSRGTVMGVWSACASVGNIIGSLISSYALRFGYQYCFAITCFLLFIYSIIVLFQLPSAPWEIGFFKACLLPGVISYSLAYGCIKQVNYGFFFWLPYYLNNGLKWPESHADSLSIWYDVGSIASAIIAGAFSDRMRSRTPIVVTMLLISIPSLYIYAHSPRSFYCNTFLLMITGFFIDGPANMISSSITADLGKCEELRGNAEALSTVTGIIDGTGSMGGAIGQFFIPFVQLWFGWNAVFYGFMIMILCTVLCLAPVLWKERMEYGGHRSEEVDFLLGDHSDSDDDIVNDIQEVRRRPIGSAV